ncbi:hypothetical protein LTR86_004425 [Recurvomyces mirabilis]|nr:hypothetical protein LTR86_004425 [Recurvomyces mirabilis]
MSTRVGPGMGENEIEADVAAVRLAAGHCDEVCEIVEKAVGKEAEALEKALVKVRDMQGATNYSDERFRRRKYHRKVGTIISRHEAEYRGVLGAEGVVGRLREYLEWIGRTREYAGFLERMEELLGFIRSNRTSIVQYQKWILTTGVQNDPFAGDGSIPHDLILLMLKRYLCLCSFVIL